MSTPRHAFRVCVKFSVNTIVCHGHTVMSYSALDHSSQWFSDFTVQVSSPLACSMNRPNPNHVPKCVEIAYEHG
jgi:hypothetical protein